MNAPEKEETPRAVQASGGFENKANHTTTTRRCLLYRTGDIEATLMRFRTGPKNNGAA